EVRAGTIDLSERLATLGTVEVTSYRRIVKISVGSLLDALRGDVELEARAVRHAARLQIRRAAPPCDFVGEAGGTKVLATGFQPFPADAWHDNVSRVGLWAAKPVPGVRLMRVELP